MIKLPKLDLDQIDPFITPSVWQYRQVVDPLKESPLVSLAGASIRCQRMLQVVLRHSLGPGPDPLRGRKVWVARRGGSLLGWGAPLPPSG